MKSIYYFVVYCLYLPLACFAQVDAPVVLKVDSLPAQGVVLDQGWKFQPGDNKEWAKPSFDDSNWQAIDPTQDIRSIHQLWQNNVVWFRLHFSADSSLRNQSLAMLVQQTGASEIYLNGHLIHRLGRVSIKPEEVLAQTLPINQMIGLPLGNSPVQVLAVRFTLQKDIHYFQFIGRTNSCLQLTVNEVSAAARTISSNDITPFEYFRAGIFFILALLHLGFFWFYPVQRANLYFFLYAFFLALLSVEVNLAYSVYAIETKIYMLLFAYVCGLISNTFYLIAFYKLIKLRKGLIFWLLIFATILLFPLCFWLYFQGGTLYIVYTLLISLESIRITIIALKTRQRGAKILAWGAVCFFVFFSIAVAIIFEFLPSGPHWIIGHWVYNISILSFPISISLFLAREFSFTSRSLETKLVEVQQLSAQTIAQEQEKQQLLATENERLEQQVHERTQELTYQKEELQSTVEYLKATQNQLIQSEKMASLGELTAGIAHEIQNPLNFVNNFSEVSEELVNELKYGPFEKLPANDKEEAQAILNDLSQNLEKIHHHGRRADSIVKNMLQHSRTSSGEKQLTDVNALVDEYLRLAYHGLRAKDKDFTAEFKLEADPSVGKVDVVPQEIGRVLLNLFNNAFYAINQKKHQLNGQYRPEVRVVTQKVENKIEIKVKDNGTGIPESVKNKIFQPFFTTKPTGEGTGLGLSLSYDIIAKGHGGELKVESKEGEYSEFIISLPT